MGFSNKIDRSNLKVGDHIYRYTLGFKSTRHGIYVGNDRVIQYRKLGKNPRSTSKSKSCAKCGYQRGVVECCLDCFLDGHTLRLFKYNVSLGPDTNILARTWTTEPHDAAGVVNRATQMLARMEAKDDKTSANCYSIFEKHRRAFAFYCTTGKKVKDGPPSIKDKVKIAVKKLSRTDVILENADVILLVAGELTQGDIDGSSSVPEQPEEDQQVEAGDEGEDDAV